MGELSVHSPTGPPSAGAVDLSDYMSDQALEIRGLSMAEWGADRAVELIGQSSVFLDLLRKTAKVAPYREPVLITGESGVGKELLSEAIYLLSDLRGEPYVSVNCPQHRDGNLTVSELFGHRRGSFTGAIADRKGAFEEADGGVIFLDEIADLHLSAQAMLLRALASGEFKPVGTDRPRSANVRVIAATNRSPNQLMVGKEFRNDLYFRLRYFQLQVPPLRDRGDDWHVILEHLLVRLRNEHGISKRFTPASLKLLDGYHWPGNVRELISVVTMGYAMADGDAIEPDDFASQIELQDEVAAEPHSLYRRVVIEGEDFWDTVYRPFMDRDLNRSQVKAFIQQGLLSAQGSYRNLLDLVGVPADQYQKFMDFLRHHDLKP